MIQVPSVGGSSGQRYFTDSLDPDVWYVDTLVPAPVGRKTAVRWMPLPDAAYLAGEVRFGPGGEEPEARRGMPRRWLPVPWEIAPVHAWYREGDRAKIVAEGRTSGFSTSNAVFSGTAPLAAMVSTVVIAAELSCEAEVAATPARRVRGSGRLEALQDVLLHAELAEHGAWDATIAAALVKMLSAAIDVAALRLTIDGDGAAAEELREAALLEWAHRIREALAPGVSLAFPASLVPGTRLQVPVTLDLDWASGSRFRLRTVKSLHTNG